MKTIIHFLAPLLVAGGLIFGGVKLLTHKNVSSQAIASNQDAQITETKAGIAQQVAAEATTTDKTSGAAATTAATNGTNAARTKIIEYTVQQGDTVGSIAQKFGISVDTILVQNNLKAQSLIRPGEHLSILPISGVAYEVRSGDTLSGIASEFNVSADKISEANDISSDGYLKIGQTLIIPGATGQIHSALAQGNVSARTESSTYRPKTASYYQGSGSVVWTSGALSELYRVPSFVRPTVRAKVTSYAASHGIRVITTEVYNSIHV